MTHARILANDLMRKHDLTGWSFGFDRAVTRLGACHYHKRMITLSSVVLRNMTDAQVKNTILHEIAHAKAGHAAGHGPVWRSICLSIGGDGKRCGDAGVSVREQEAKYAIYCKEGDHELGYVFRRNFKVDRRLCRTHLSSVVLRARW